MEKTEKITFEHNSFGSRLKSMLSVDFRRLFTTRIFYIMVGIALVIPVLMLVMSTSVGSSDAVDPAAGVEIVEERDPYTNVWQVVESIDGESSGISTDMLSMCNVNMLFFMAAILVCVFTTDDFTSGYSKNLFAVRSGKTDYVISKALVGIVSGAFMILAYLIGSVIGGAIAGLSFDAGVAGISGIVMCLVSKILLMAVFVPVALLWSVVGKQKLWLAIAGSFAISLLFFMMIPTLTPLNSGIFNVVICLIGGVLFSGGLGAVSSLILNKTSLV